MIISNHSGQELDLIQSKKQWESLSSLWFLTAVSSLGEAPWCRSKLMMCVCPCWAAWCRGVYPFCKGRSGVQTKPTECKHKQLHVFTITDSVYLGLSVDLRLILQQEVDHLHVAIVTGNVKRGVSQLTTKTREYKYLFSLFTFTDLSINRKIWSHLCRTETYIWKGNKILVQSFQITLRFFVLFL